MNTWQRTKLIFEVVEVRLRFIAVLVATALFIGYWDTIKNYYDKWSRPASVASREVDRDHELYCPMHPQVVRTSLEPNGDWPKCPICNMPLDLRKKGDTKPLPPGVTARVQVSPERIQLAGVQTVAIGYQPLTRQITTLGNVTFDESRRSQVVSRVAGYVEKLYADRTYVKVTKGELLAEIYSPELYSTAQELLLAVQRSATADLVTSARKRLKLLGIGDQEIDAIVKSGKATPRLAIRSPQSGYVIDKKIVDGSRVEEGMTLFDVADLSAVWIEADVYEKDIALLRTGEAVEATVSSLGDRTFSGKIAAIYPRIETGTRTNRVRFELDNADNQLRPGMFATVEIKTPLGEPEAYKDTRNAKGEVLAVPERAVIDTGARQIVYVEREPGLYEGVAVKLGPRVGDVYPVLQGLTPGQRVVAAGAFLIDAETRLNPAAGATYFGTSGGPTSTGQPAATVQSQTSAAPPPAVVELSPKMLANIAKLPPEDRAAAKAQRLCPITGKPLGSMGAPIKIELKGEAVFLCCTGCEDQAKDSPDETLKKVHELKGRK